MAKKILKIVAVVAAVALLLVYGGYQVFRAVSPSVETETVYRHSMYETVETTCFAVRSETLLYKDTDGYIYYTAQDGSRVAKGGTIADIFPAQADAAVHQQLEDIDAEVASLRAVQAQGSAQHTNLETVRGQIRAKLTALAALGEQEGEGADALAAELTALFNKQQIITGKVADFSARIALLEEERARLAAGYRKRIGRVSAPRAGYFVSVADGYEQVLTPDRLSGIRVADIEAAVAATPVPADAHCVGKIVGDYEWYLVCTVPERYLSYLEQGAKRTVRMPFVSDSSIPVTVVSCSRESSGKLAVVLKCTSMSEALSTARVEKLQIQLVEHTGLRVPKEAIVTDENFQTGVYVRVGYTAVFRKIEQAYAEAGAYVICTETDEKGYLKLYDDVVVKGKNLYDGKLLR